MNDKRDLLQCLAWISAALIIGGFVWFFTLPYRTSLLVEEVNKSLASNGIYERIAETAPVLGNPSVGGQWFALNNSSNLVYVFTLMHGGNAAACAALTRSDGGVVSLLPLGSNSNQIIKELPPPVYRFYERRIEQNAQKRMGGRKP